MFGSLELRVDRLEYGDEDGSMKMEIGVSTFVGNLS